MRAAPHRARSPGGDTPPGSGPPGAAPRPGQVPRGLPIRTCVGEAKVKDICPGPAAGAGAAAASA